MTDERRAAIRAAISKLDMSNDEHTTSSGAPDVHAINTQMPDGSDRVSAAERDEVWSAMVEDGEGKGGDVVQPAALDPEAGHDLATVGPIPGAADETEPAVQPTHPPPVPPAVQPAAQDPAAGHDLATLTVADDGEAGRAKGKTRITIVSAYADPIPVYINGRGPTTLAVGKPHDVEPDVLEALRHASGVVIREER